MLRTMLAGCVLSLVAACAPAIQRNVAGDADLESAIRVEVMNDHWSDVEVFLVRGQDRRRLGTVRGGGASAHFVLSGRLIIAGDEARVRVESNDMSGAWTSDPFVAAKGKTTGFRVAQDVGASMRVW